MGKVKEILLEREFNEAVEDMEIELDYKLWQDNLRCDIDDAIRAIINIDDVREVILGSMGKLSLYGHVLDTNQMLEAFKKHI